MIKNQTILPVPVNSSKSYFLPIAMRNTILEEIDRTALKGNSSMVDPNFTIMSTFQDLI